MKPWIRSGDAPGYTVVTLTTVFESFGYCRTPKLVAARKPISRISRLTTRANTGRLMKISVQTIVMRSVRSGSDYIESDRDLISLFDRDRQGKRLAFVPRSMRLVTRRSCRDWRRRVG